MSKLETLVKDVYELFQHPHECSEDNLEILVEGIKQSVREAFAQKMSKSENKLRLSNYGWPSRKLYYSIKRHREKEAEQREAKPQDQIKFLVGHLMEALLLFLAKEADHEVSDEGKYVEIEGVRGKLDAKIDGTTVDVKTASNFSFNKFKSGEILLGDENDPFGYLYQLGGYIDSQGESEGGLLAFNKESGEICLVHADVMDLPNVSEKINKERENLSKEEPPPEKCYPETPQYKKKDNGNRVLHKLCTFCEHKFECWKDANGGKGLRSYDYAFGPVYFTHVEKEPRVKEQTEDGN